jgi:hypothetical protein
MDTEETICCPYAVRIHALLHKELQTHCYFRVLSRIKTLVQDEDDVLDSEDQHVFGILKTFLHGDDVKTVFGAKQCLDWIERAVGNSSSR